MNKYNTKLVVVLAFIIAMGLFLFMNYGSQATSAMALKPAYMDRYALDPYSREELRSNCTVCHIGHGGGERNDFGEAFEDAGFRITPKLRARFPELFQGREGNMSDF